jgi:hypothetical protein
MKGRTYLVTSTGPQTITFTSTTLTSSDGGFFVIVRNGNGVGGGDITMSGVSGNTKVHEQTNTQSGQIVYVYWNGSTLRGY